MNANILQGTTGILSHNLQDECFIQSRKDANLLPCEFLLFLWGNEKIIHFMIKQAK